MTAPNPVVREADAALYLGVSQAYLRKARRLRQGPAFIRVGRMVRYQIRDLDHWLTSHRVTPRGESR